MWLVDQWLSQYTTEHLENSKMFAVRSLWMAQKKVSRADLIKNGLTRFVKNRCVLGR